MRQSIKIHSTTRSFYAVLPCRTAIVVPDPRLRVRDHPPSLLRMALVECCGELAVPVADQEPKGTGPLAGVHHQIPGLPGSPGPGRMSGNTKDAHRPCRDLRHEQHVHTLERTASTGGNSQMAFIRGVRGRVVMIRSLRVRGDV